MLVIKYISLIRISQVMTLDVFFFSPSIILNVFYAKPTCNQPQGGCWRIGYCLTSDRSSHARKLYSVDMYFIDNLACVLKDLLWKLH